MHVVQIHLTEPNRINVNIHKHPSSSSSQPELLNSHASCNMHSQIHIMQHAHAGGTTLDGAQNEKAHASIHHIRALRAETCRVYNVVTCTCILLMFDSRGYTTHQTKINNIQLSSNVAPNVFFTDRLFGSVTVRDCSNTRAHGRIHE